MNDDYVDVLNPKVKTLTFTKVNKNIGTQIDNPLNLKSSQIGKWDVVPVMGPDLETEKGIKFKSGLNSSFPVIYSSKYQNRG